jgi:uncharacterized protein (TIGR03435 family)
MRILAAVVCVTAGLVHAQPAKTFEVASVKRAEGGGPPGDIPRNMDDSPGHFAMRNVPMRYILEWAYDLKDYEISGPDWIRAEDRYDIVAKAQGPASNEEMRPMLQALVVERFQLKSHRETRELPVYALAPGKGAPKVKDASAAEDGPGIKGGPNGVSFHKQPISRLTFLLTRRLDRPVLDLTGLKGVYDFTLDISGLPNGQGVTDPASPSIFSAVQNDMGLKLEARKEPIQILVIDSVNRNPSAN